jgi:hypothetical protein
MQRETELINNSAIIENLSEDKENLPRTITLTNNHDSMIKWRQDQPSKINFIELYRIIAKY